jgi:hypothetical protein
MRATGDIGANSAFSNAVSAGKRLKVWNTKLTPWRLNSNSALRDIRVMSHPATTTRPSVGESRAPIMFSSVVLPEPDGPSTTTNSSGRTSNDTSASAITSFPPT